MSAYYDNLRFLTKCPDGKSLTLHVEQLCARVEKLEKVREAAARYCRAEGHRDTHNADAYLRAALAECGEVGE